MKNSEFSKKVGQFTAYALEETTLNDFVKEIFEVEEYAFVTSKKRPRIIDCGSHIGLSVLYFKSKYPGSKIICFEPDPNNYRLLRENITRNQLSNIQTIQAAISDTEGSAPLYGYVESPADISLGNSLIKSWGEREGSSSIPVTTVRLSRYIIEPVDYLKLNIEGSETAVLHDLFKSGAIQYIKEMYVQYHQTKQNNSDAEFQELMQKLKNEGFTIHVTEKDLRAYLPLNLESWVKAVQPSIKVMRCRRMP